MYGKKIEDIKAMQLAAESGLHHDTTPMVTSYTTNNDVVAEPKTEAPKKKASKKRKK